MKAAKEKVTFTLKRRTILNLRRVSRIRKTTIDAVVEDLARNLEAKGQDASGPDLSWLDATAGSLTGKFTQKDFDADPRLAKIMGAKSKNA